MQTEWYEVVVLAKKTVLIEVNANGVFSGEDQAEIMALNDAFGSCDDVETGAVTKINDIENLQAHKERVDQVMSALVGNDG